MARPTVFNYEEYLVIAGKRKIDSRNKGRIRIVYRDMNEIDEEDNKIPMLRNIREVRSRARKQREMNRSKEERNLEIMRRKRKQYREEEYFRDDNSLGIDEKDRTCKKVCDKLSKSSESGDLIKTVCERNTSPESEKEIETRIVVEEISDENDSIEETIEMIENINKLEGETKFRRGYIDIVKN